MTKQQISETYGLKIELLNKMEEDSKGGSMVRKMNYMFKDNLYVEIIFRNGILETQTKGIAGDLLIGEKVRNLRNEHQ